MKALNKIIKNRKTLIFMDLEGTQFSHEMIAIGAIKVNLRKDGSIKKIHKGYYSLVQAKNKIGRVVEDLTGLNDKIIKEQGKKLRVVIQELKKYVGKDFASALYVTYGNHDCRILAQSLIYNLDAPSDDIKILIKHNFDISEWISNYIKDEHGNNYSLSNILKVFSVDFQGQKHNALSDTYNLVLLYDSITKNSEVIAREYIKVLSLGRGMPDVVSILMKRIINENKSVSLEDLKKIIKEAVD